MDNRKWAAKVFRYRYMKSVDTQWRRKTRRLTMKYVNNSGGAKTAKMTKKEVKETETNKWREKNGIEYVVIHEQGREVRYQKGKSLR